jgi:hypothetical protein
MYGGEHLDNPAHHDYEPAGLRVNPEQRTPFAPRLWNNLGVELSPEGYRYFILRIFIAPDYTMRVMCSAPGYLGCYFHKAFRNIYKLPRLLDHDMEVEHDDSPNDFTHAVMPSGWNQPTYVHADTEQ